jgi:hypothetical protein
VPHLGAHFIKTQGPEVLRDQRGSAHFPIRELRMFVDITPPGDYPILNLSGR